MTIINLRKYYPKLYSSDYEIAVPDEVAAALRELKLSEAAFRLRTYRAKAYYSLDCGDQIEREALFMALSPHEVLEQRMMNEQLYAALDSLPDKQRERIYAHYFLGVSKAAIARAENVNEGNIRKSISHGLRSMAIFLKKYL